MSMDNFEQLSLKISTVFTPAAPINQITLFAGRKQQIREILGTINQRGQHAIIFGERGVGKTSLANVLHDFIKPLFPKDLLVVNLGLYNTIDSIYNRVRWITIN